MRKSTTLEARLVEWGKEYGGGKYQDIGWHGISPMAVMMKWHGRPPEGLGYHPTVTGADEVQRAVDRIGAGESGALLSSILEKEYQTPGLAVHSRLQRIRHEHGLSLQRTTYYKHLRKARSMVADLIGVADDADESEDQECAA